MHKEFQFPNSRGEQLSGRLELPDTPTKKAALFAHCFTCGKDILAAPRVSQALAGKGLAVLRFDFTGLGNSQGDFANTHFSSNVQDLVSAAEALTAEGYSVELLIGHSLGGAAVLAAAEQVESAKGVVTIGAPAEPAHVEHLFTDNLEAIEKGEAEVKLGGRVFQIRRSFLDDIRSQVLKEKISKLGKALLVFHSPLDDTVGIDNAAAIYQSAKHPKSFVSLDQADHLLSRRSDSQYVAEVIKAWAQRYLEAEVVEQPSLEVGAVEVSTHSGKFTQQVHTAKHSFLADEPLKYGGDDRGPNPYEILLSALGACTTMTLQMYAARKEWDLQEAKVHLTHSRVHAQDCEDCETTEGKLELIERVLTLKGELDQEQRARLLEIADRCPVHRTLLGAKEIHTRLAEEVT